MGADGSDTMRQSSESEIEARKPSIRISTDAYSAEDNAMDKIKSSEVDDMALQLAALPPLADVVTVRAVVVGLILGFCFVIVTLKLALTVGVIPSLNIGAGLLGFCCLRGWTLGLAAIGLTPDNVPRRPENAPGFWGPFCSRAGWWYMLRCIGPSTKPFTKQENTVIQTFVVATYGTAFTGGFGSYLLSLDQQTYENLGPSEANTSADVFNPIPSRTYTFTLCTAAVGVFAVLVLRKVFILNYRLPYPSGHATGMLINSFHTEEGSKLAMRQVKVMGFWFAMSFAWALFTWFFSATSTTDGKDCSGGFGSFPTFGLTAYAWTWYFDFNLSYVGAGMISPHIANLSMLFGAILSYGIMWPLLSNREGDWYPAGLKASDPRGLYGYKVFLSLGLLLGDAVWNVGSIIVMSIQAHRQARKQLQLPKAAGDVQDPVEKYMHTGLKGVTDKLESEQERRLRTTVFLRSNLPWWVGVGGYVALTILSIIVIPLLYSPVPRYFILLGFLAGPIFAAANAYCAGLTDWNISSLYGKLGIFVFAAWAGTSYGVTCGLVMCGVLFASAGAGSDLMQDFKTGYLTLSSATAMFVAQCLGALGGVIISPSVFQLFYSAFPLGQQGSAYPAPFADVYRSLAVVGVEGLGALPEYCLALTGGFFGIALMFNIVKHFLPVQYARFVPIPSAMSIPFYLGAYIALDMCVGTAIKFFWYWVSPEGAGAFCAAAASGLIAGSGIWALPSAIMALAGYDPPVCMNFVNGGS